MVGAWLADAAICLGACGSHAALRPSTPGRGAGGGDHRRTAFGVVNRWKVVDAAKCTALLAFLLSA